MRKQKHEENSHGHGPILRKIAFGLLERKTGEVRIEHLETCLGAP